MAEMPRLIRPMTATLRRSLPVDQDRYGWEFKWDGVRAIAYVSGGEVRLVSRRDKDMAASCPELAVLADRIHAPVILDGEIVALHARRPDFGVLQSRMHVRRPPARLLEGAPVQLYLFDVLYHGQDSLLGLPYTQRRDRLEDLGLDADPVQPDGADRRRPARVEEGRQRPADVRHLPPAVRVDEAGAGTERCRAG